MSRLIPHPWVTVGKLAKSLLNLFLYFVRSLRYFCLAESLKVAVLCVLCALVQLKGKKDGITSQDARPPCPPGWKLSESSFFWRDFYRVCLHMSFPSTFPPAPAVPLCLPSLSPVCPCGGCSCRYACWLASLSLVLLCFVTRIIQYVKSDHITPPPHPPALPQVYGRGSQHLPPFYHTWGLWPSSVGRLTPTKIFPLEASPPGQLRISVKGLGNHWDLCHLASL